MTTLHQTDTALQKEAISVINSVPEKKLPLLIQFARFLSSPAFDVPENHSSFQQMSLAEKRRRTAVQQMSLAEKRRRTAGILKGRIWMADDFNETPDCFK